MDIAINPVLDFQSMTAVLTLGEEGLPILGAWTGMEALARMDPEGCVRLNPNLPMDIPALAAFFHCTVSIVEKTVELFGKLNRLTVKDGLIRICSCVTGKEEDEAREHRNELNRMRVRRFREKKKRERMMADVMHPVMDVMVSEEKRKKQRKENINNNNNKYSHKLISIYEPGEKMETGVTLPENNSRMISSDMLPAPCRNVLEAWNKLPLKKFTGLFPSLLQKLNDLLASYGEAAVRKAVESIGRSPFLLGKKGKGFYVTLGWLLEPGNFAKVLSGKYQDRNDAGNSYMDWQPGERFPFYLPGEGEKPMDEERTQQALYDYFHPANPVLEKAARLLGLAR